MVLKKQVNLEPEYKWGRYLRTPLIFFKLISHPKIIRLSKVADVKSGVKTGADRFFYLDNETIQKWGIEKDYVKPIVTSPREIKFCKLRKDDLSNFVFMVHETKEKLEKRRANALEYIKWGENVDVRIKGGVKSGTLTKGFHSLRTTSQRKVWYDLGKRKPAKVLFPNFIYERTFAVWNTVGAYADYNIYEINPKDEEDTLLLVSFLNSSIAASFEEIFGRAYKEGVLDVKIYELREMPVLDPKEIPEDKKQIVEKVFMKLCEAQRKNNQKVEKEALGELDEAFFDVLDLSKEEREQVFTGLEYLKKIRISRKKVTMLVETEEGWKPSTKYKKRMVKSSKDLSKRLETWMK